MNIYYLLIIPVLLSAVLKATFQSVVIRKYVRNGTDIIYYNLFMFAFVAVIYFFISFGKTPSPDTLRFAVLYGFFCVLFQTMQSAALEIGPVSLTILIAGFGAVFPVFYGIIFLGEQLSPANILGLVLAVVSMVLSSNAIGAEIGKLNKKWIVCVILAMLANGAVVTTAKLQKVYSPNEDEIMVFIAYATGSVLLLIYYLITGKKQAKTIVPGIGFFSRTLLVSLAMCAYMPIMLVVMGNLPVAVVSPILNIGSAMLMSVAGLLIFKDSLTLSQKIGLAVGIPAVCLITL